jgi:predicted negative regulator of RcsB-dependent stress response
VQIVKLRLADAQLAQKKYDDAIENLIALVTEPAFKATADELRGDIYVAKKDICKCEKSLSKCMG